MKRRLFLQCASAALLSPVVTLAQSNYPNKPIRYIVPVSAGGGSDILGRNLTDVWRTILGQSFVVENQAGGGGVIACQTTARSAPDGYTLVQGYVATHGTNPATRKVPYDPLKDFSAIGMIGATPNALVVPIDLPVSTLAEFIALVRSNSKKMSYGSSGPGSLTHLTMELFMQAINAHMEHIPYRGIAPAFTDLNAGQTQAMFPGLAAATPHIKAGRVKALAVTGPQRHPLYKDVPTLDESGFKGFDAQQWYGVFGPAGMPADIVKKLNETLATAITSPALKEKFALEAIEPSVMTPGQFAAFVETDIARWAAIAKDRNIELEN